MTIPQTVLDLLSRDEKQLLVPRLTEIDGTYIKAATVRIIGTYYFAFYFARVEPFPGIIFIFEERLHC